MFGNNDGAGGESVAIQKTIFRENALFFGFSWFTVMSTALELP
jgi:hypothetical protein